MAALVLLVQFLFFLFIFFTVGSISPQNLIHEQQEVFFVFFTFVNKTLCSKMFQLLVSAFY